MAINIQKEFGDLLDLIAEKVSEDPDTLNHHGVKGMKWGVRKNNEGGSSSKKASLLVGLGPDKIVRTTPSGETLTLTRDRPPAIIKLLSKMSKKAVENYNNAAFLTIKDESGKSVGEAQLEKRSSEEINVVWVGVRGHSRGKGYATQTMLAVEEFSRSSGFKKITLEVPGESPDARHIYEKMGFKALKSDPDPDDIWGGLTNMEYVLNDAKHSSIRTERQIMSDTIGDGSYEDYLAHYGVKGMRWGKRSAGGSGSSGEGSGKPEKLRGKARTVAIKDARKRIIDNVNKHNEGEYQSKMGLTSKDRQKGRETARKALMALDSMDNNGDRQLAEKMTRGEKAATSILWGVTGAMIIGSATSGMNPPRR